MKHAKPFCVDRDLLRSAVAGGVAGLVFAVSAVWLEDNVVVLPTVVLPRMQLLVSRLRWVLWRSAVHTAVCAPFACLAVVLTGGAVERALCEVASWFLRRGSVLPHPTPFPEWKGPFSRDCLGDDHASDYSQV